MPTDNPVNCCDRKSQAAWAQSFAPWQQATIEIMLAISLTIACSRYTYDGVILHAHPVRRESYNQRNATGEVATQLEMMNTAKHTRVKSYCGCFQPSWFRQIKNALLVDIRQNQSFFVNQQSKKVLHLYKLFASRPIISRMELDSCHSQKASCTAVAVHHFPSDWVKEINCI